MDQDPLLHPLDRRRRREPELLVEEDPKPLVRPEGLGVSSGSVQGQHQQLAGPFPHRVLADGRVEERDHIRCPSGCQLGRRQGLDGIEMEVLQPADVGLCELVVGKVGQRRTPPELECSAEDGRAVVEPVGLDGPCSLLDQPLEPAGVDRVRIDVQLVAGRTGDDEAIAPGRRLECLSKLGYVDLDGVERRPRRGLSPQQVDQAIRRDDLAGVEEEDRQKGPLLGRTELGACVVGARFEGPEDPELHRLPLWRRDCGRWWRRPRARSTGNRLGNAVLGTLYGLPRAPGRAGPHASHACFLVIRGTLAL